MAEEKRCKFERKYERLDKEPCRRPYFTTWKDPETGEEKDYCIFHAPMEAKRDKIEEFWKAFKVYFKKTQKEYEADEEEKKKIGLNCDGFIFPDTGKRFNGREFPFVVSFEFAQFTGAAYFWGAQFTDNAYFRDAQFTDAAGFSGAQFAGDARFTHTQFTGGAYFRDAQFTGTAYFSRAQFTGDADFEGAQFTRRVYFRRAQFSNDASFERAKFRAAARFESARFMGYADFRRITVDKDGRDAGTLLFRYVFFSDPNRVYVGGPGIKKCSIIGTNIEGVHFVDPEWSRRKGPFKRYRKKAFDEELAEKGHISWEDAVEVYRKLRRNFEGRLAYETAGDFHYGQMWCRIWDKNRARWDRILTWFYWVLFSFGESVSKPLIWLAVSFLLFTGFFLLHGFPVPDAAGLNWDWGFAGGNPLTRLWWCQLLEGGFFTLISAFSFSVPEGGTNSLVAIMFGWKLVAVTFATFFVLALRRRFKR